MCAEFRGSERFVIQRRLGAGGFGSVQPGRIADLVVLNRNPLQRIENTRAIALVIQRGKVVR